MTLEYTSPIAYMPSPAPLNRPNNRHCLMQGFSAFHCHAINGRQMSKGQELTAMTDQWPTTPRLSTCLSGNHNNPHTDAASNRIPLLIVCDCIAAYFTEDYSFKQIAMLTVFCFSPVLNIVSQVSEKVTIGCKSSRATRA